MGITNFVYNLIENIITLVNKYFNLAFIMAISSLNIYKPKKGEKPLFRNLIGFLLSSFTTLILLMLTITVDTINKCTDRESICQ